MKQNISLLTVIVVCGFFGLASCNSGEDKKTTDTAMVKDSTNMAPPTPVSPMPTKIVVIKHKVANFDKWKMVYDADDTARMAYGLHNYVIGRGLQDSNMVLIALKTDDFSKAKEFAARPALKAAMQKGGVMGAPGMTYVDIAWQDTSNNMLPVRVMITHKVKDWDAWKKTFDSHAQMRKDAGLIDRSVSHEEGNPTSVRVVLAAADQAKAEAFFASKETKDRMAAGGVEGPVSFFYYRVAQKY